MTLEDQCALSYYKEIGILNEDKGYLLVQERRSGRLCLQKTLTVFNAEVYRTLMAHPVRNTPRIRLIIEEDDTLTVIEDFLSGITLKAVLAEEGTLPPERTGGIAIQLCRILGQLHGMNPPIVHRDIKPSNILITDDGIVKLLDMNAAREAHNADNSDTRLLGTAGFAAPEQYGFGASGPRTDLYAVGVLMNVMLTGVLPSEQRAAGPLGPVIDRCLQIDPSLRWDDAAALEQAIRRAVPGADKAAAAYASRPEKHGTDDFRYSNSDTAAYTSRMGDRSAADLRYRKSDSAGHISGSRERSAADAVTASGSADFREYSSPKMRDGTSGPSSSSLRRFLPPGFRTGQGWKMVLGSIGYMMLLFGTINMTSGSNPPDIFLNKITFFLIGIFVIFISCNYLGIQEHLPLARSSRRLRHIIGVILWDGVAAFALLLILVLAEVFLGWG